MSGTNYSAPNFSIPYVAPQNIPPELIPIIQPIYIAFQNIIQTLVNFAGIAPRAPAAIASSIDDPTAFLANNVHRFYIQATEVIAQGSPVNLFGSGSSLFARNARANSISTKAWGFCSQTGGLALGQVGEVILGDGLVQGLSGLVPGTEYYLSTTSGSYQSAAPTGSGNVQQSLGIALTPTDLRFLQGLAISL